MRADCADVTEAIEAYVIGALDDDEARAVAAHVEGCAECATAVERAGATSHALAFAVPLATPDASVKATVMAGALALRSARRYARSRWRIHAAAAAVVLVAAGAIVWGAVSQYRLHALSGTNASLRADAALAGARLATVEAQLALASDTADRATELSAFSDTLLDVSRQPDAEDIRLAGTTLAPSATGRYVWSQARDTGALDVAQLPALAEGMSYELTIVYSDHTESGGTFAVDHDGRGILVVHETDEEHDGTQPRGFSVAIIPGGKTADASSPVVLAGALSE